ncbi:translocation/assembly module TamB, partial [Alistipes sp. OttesenSCG-928-L06]|nr:translocation/assembly module TamB [Alistipes sp. OttesenSCG-928-L06]
VDFDLGRQQAGVGLIRLERGDYAYLTDTAAVASPVEPEPEPDSASTLWNIRVDRLELAENAFRYGILNGQPQPGFDPDHIALENMNIDVREAYYRPGALGASIRALAARERSGLEITRGEGAFSMDSTRIVLSGFELQTAHSSFSADAEAAAGLLTQQPDAPLSATIRADVSPLDLYYFMTPDPALRQALAGKTLRIGGDLSGTLAALDVRALTAEMPGHIDFRVSGQAARLTDPENLEAQARFSGTFAGLEFLRPLLPDSLRGRIGFPRRLTLDGSLAMAGETYVPDLRLTADSGSLALKGRVDLRRETYRAEVATADFPLDAFLPQDTLGRLSFRLTADGNSFDPRRDGAAADVRFALERFDFKQYTYHDITLDARLAEHRLAGRLASETEAAKFDFGLDGTLSAEEYAARLTGKLDTLDLHRLGFMPEPFDASLWIDASVAYRPDSAYRADLSLDSLRWRHGRQTDRIAPTSLQASADPRGLKAALRSGDLALDFNAPVSLDALLSGFTTAAELVMAQVDSADINMTPVQEALPEFTLTVRARRENILHTLLQDSGLDFGQVNLRLTTVNENPLRLAFVVNSLKTAGLTLDTLNVGFWRKDEQLNYFVRLANRPGNIEQMALIALAGNVHGNQARLNVFQRDRTDSVGFRFGLTGELLDSAVRVRMNSARPIFGYIPWTVNDDNYMVYHFDQRLDADLRLEGPVSGQYFRLRSAPLPTLPTGGARLELARIDVGGLLSLLPSPPPVGGQLNSDIRFGFDQGQVVGVGTLGVDGLVYDKKRVGDIGLDVDFQSGEQQRFSLKGEATVDKQPVLTVNGTLRTGDDGDLTVRMNIPSFPLTATNAFLPEEQAQLTGALAGWLSLSGALSDPTVNGELRFNAGKISVPMLGTTYGLAAVPMKIASNRLDFNGFGLLSPNNQPLTLNGTLDFRNLSKMTADVSLRTQNFDVIHSSRDGGSTIYGRAPVDIGLTARGPVNALTVRGDIRLRRGTDVTYTLEDGPQEVESVKQNLVTFVDLNDPSTFEPADSTHRLAVFGMDMLVNINIEENVGVTVNISPDGSNRAEMSGAGNLTYTLNTQGDSRFTGRFDVSSGRILYSPPVIATKDFAIDEDSAVEWTGDMLNPAVDITAVSTVRTKVEFSDGSQDVNFQVMILIRNLLEELEVVFDLAAPNNLVITNDLRQMTAEQRMQQALNLLATGAYTGPSAKGKA